MSKIEDAKLILEALGLPKKQQNERSALVLLALCHLKEDDKWSKAMAISMSVVGNREHAKYSGIMRFIALNYNKQYAENSRETLRRQTIHQFVQAGIISHNPEDPDLPTTSQDNHYRLTHEALKVIKSFGTNNWVKEVGNFRKNIGSLNDKYLKKREFHKISVRLKKGIVLKLSPGKHNRVQKAVMEEFAPRFAPGSILLYIGDTANKDLFVDIPKLKKLGIQIDEHGKLPDIVLFDKKRNWLFLIEAVTSHGPMSPKRLIELDEMLKDSNVGKIFVSAFPDLKEFRKHTSDLAWDTEVWIAEIPDHMIHFNGDKFLGPR